MVEETTLVADVPVVTVVTATRIVGVETVAEVDPVVVLSVVAAAEVLARRTMHLRSRRMARSITSSVRESQT